MTTGNKSVGFVVDGLLPSFAFASMRRLGPLSVFMGGRSHTAMGVMRFGWIADAVNSHAGYGMHYELYRPFRTYDMLIFVKSMNPACMELARQYSAMGKPVLLDINVNSFDPPEGNYYYDGMKPTQEQNENAIAMAKKCDGVMASSLVIEQAAGKYNPVTACIPDNVRLDAVPPDNGSSGLSGKHLRLLWSGQAVKLFDLLAIEDVLRDFRANLELVLVTSDLSAMELVYEPYRSRLKKLLADLNCRIIRYESIPQLLNVYQEGGIVISPRFMDSPYNLGHTEWKITLGMACGRMAVCSPLRSYREVAKLSGGRGLRICEDSAGWSAVFDAMLGNHFDWMQEQTAAREVVSEHYSSTVIAEKHAGFVTGLMKL